MKKFLGLFLVSFLGGLFSLGIYKVYFEKDAIIVENKDETPKFITTNYANPAAVRPIVSAENVDFTEAAEKTVHAVVHVQNVTVNKRSGSILDFFYGSEGRRDRAQVGTGSGVIISPDGYIVTNNHVIANSSHLRVKLNNNKVYDAELVGSDPGTDIALIKVDTEENLPFLAFGDSDNTKIGEWVLAVGNPFNLTSTVTAGIISAKARDLNENDRRNQSFIQTDAAVNPGNSGGALVNTNGDLIGINTAITSQTGSFVGYAFAVPSNIAKKVVHDLLEYGNVQQGILGVRGGGLNSAYAERIGVDDTEGFYIDEVIGNSGAEKAGLKKGDIIKKMDNVEISKYSDLTGYLGSKRPNDVIDVTIKRNGRTQVVPVTLFKNQSYRINLLNIEVDNLSKADKQRFNVDYGVKVSNVTSQRGTYLLDKILLEVDGKKVKNVDDVRRIFDSYADYEGPESIVVLDGKGEKERLIFE
ncbi:PDZ domain-containing protein [Leptobacterium flavescens]|uniref:PDZ domain-containing protein n=1 Tax=Leptobacterium flavescens TaxID=472055 RepID=A0A6P0UJ90_9FLAO|nr:trypsin-like peptidase domain-containing protein [Leptobacterium flavescens]NER13284.1 PDZ domain-containing protein [Leptobacterium flavescens]